MVLGGGAIASCLLSSPWTEFAKESVLCIHLKAHRSWEHSCKHLKISSSGELEAGLLLTISPGAVEYSPWGGIVWSALVWCLFLMHSTHPFFYSSLCSISMKHDRDILHVEIAQWCGRSVQVSHNFHHCWWPREHEMSKWVKGLASKQVEGELEGSDSTALSWHYWGLMVSCPWSSPLKLGFLLKS